MGRKLAPTQATLAAAVSLAAANVALVAGNTAANLLLARSLPTSEYGRVAFGLNLELLLALVAGLGLTTAVVAEVARIGTPPSLGWETVGGLLVLRLVSVLVLLTATGSWALIQRDPLPLLAGAAAGAFIVQDFVGGVLRGQLRAHAVALVVIVQPACYLLLIALLRLDRAEAVLAALIAAFSISLLLAVALLIGRRPRFSVLRRLRLDRQGAISTIAPAAYLLTFLQVAFVVLPVVVLGFFGRYAEAAALAVLMALVRLLPEVVSQVLGALYFPRLHLVGYGSADGDRLFYAAFRSILIVAVPPTVCLVLFGGPILSVLFGGRYDHVFPYLAGASPLVVGLSLETLTIWTLLSAGAARLTLIAMAFRLTVILAGAAGSFVIGSAVADPLWILVVSSVVAVALSLTILMTGLRMRRNVADPNKSGS